MQPCREGGSDDGSDDLMISERKAKL